MNDYEMMWLSAFLGMQTVQRWTKERFSERGACEKRDGTSTQKKQMEHERNTNTTHLHAYTYIKIRICNQDSRACMVANMGHTLT